MEIERLRAFKQTQEEARVPVVDDDVLELIRILIETKSIRKILEIGTATGVSALFFSEFMGDAGKVTTVEKDERNYFCALENIKNADRQDHIRVVLGDARDVLGTLESDSFDMIFLDGAKGHYIHMLDDCIRIVKPKGLIIGDNVTFRGMVTDQAPKVRRKITIIKRLKAFLEAIQSRNDIVSTVLAVGDGLSISVKK